MSILSTSPTQHGPDERTRRVELARGEQSSQLSWLDRVARRAVQSRLRSLVRGRLHLFESHSLQEFGDPESQETAEIEVLDPRFYREIALGSSLGAGDAFVRGYWQSPDLLAVMRLFAKSLTQRNDLQTVALPLQLLGRQLMRWSHRNSRPGSRRNIGRHYDLSNELFALFLDPTMSYSCGMFPDEQATMEAASHAKFERICQKLRLCADDHVVEIGCGWGGFAEYAAYHYGCRVTGVTLSTEQLQFARQRISNAGLQQRVELRLCDYRDLTGAFDKLVSIEMIEAVGHQYLATFFRKCNSLLKPDGEMLLQAITIPDDRYDYYRRHVDFIQKYIFPGGCLPSVGVLSQAISKASDLRLTHLEDFAGDYALTVLRWRDKFLASTEQLSRLGFDETFQRTWDYYFCYCAAGFLERQIGVAQLLLKRAEAR